MEQKAGSWACSITSAAAAAVTKRRMVFLLNALVLCLSVANELFDIQYCRAIAESYPDAPLVKNICIWVVEAFRQYLFLPLTLAMPIGMVYTLGGSALQTTLNTLAVVFLLEIDDLLYNAVIDARYKRYARRHRFRLRWFDYYLLCAPSVPDPQRCDGVLWTVP